MITDLEAKMMRAKSNFLSESKVRTLGGKCAYMIIRTESTSDFDDVFQLNYQAFGNREDESRLIERIRASEQFIPELSIVAEIDNEIVGHVMLSKAIVRERDTEIDVIVLAPIAVKPEFQKQGIGSKLIEEGIRRCKVLGYGIVLLIGHPSYYPRLGFQPARKHGLELQQFEVSDEVFMVYEVEDGKLQEISGELLYPAAFIS
jgi:putative acetyltransferase